MELKDLMQQVVNLSHDERVALARSAVADIARDFKEIGIQDKFADTMIFLIKLFVSADKNCSQEEYKLIKDVYDFDMSYDAFYEMSNGGAHPEYVRLVDDLVDSLPQDTKNAICLFGLAILASDDTLTAAEQALFVRILQ